MGFEERGFFGKEVERRWLPFLVVEEKAAVVGAAAENVRRALAIFV